MTRRKEKEEKTRKMRGQKNETTVRMRNGLDSEDEVVGETGRGRMGCAGDGWRGWSGTRWGGASGSTLGPRLRLCYLLIHLEGA